MRPHGIAVGVLALTALGAECRGQGLSLIENCPVDIAPVEQIAPTLPVQGKHTYSVTARFVVDVNGAVLAPSVSASRLVMAEGGAVPVPANVDRSFLDALRQWRFARRAKPCLGNLYLKFPHTI